VYPQDSYRGGGLLRTIVIMSNTKSLIDSNLVLFDSRIYDQIVIYRCIASRLISMYLVYLV